MGAAILFAFITEALKAFNAIYQDQPVAERRAAAFIWWNCSKWMVYPLLSADQRKQIDDAAAAAPQVVSA
jgi:hypothetical protein